MNASFISAGTARASVDQAPALAALAVGLTALVTPPLALLAVAALGARALMNGARPTQAQMLSLAGPFAAALGVGAFAGLDGAIGTLFVWRLFADTQWSVREARRLAASAGGSSETSFKALAHAWATPLYGLGIVAYTAPHIIAGLPLDLPHVPLWVVVLLGTIAAGMVLDWALQRAADWRLGQLACAPAAHLLIHHVLFVLAFGLMLDVSAGVFMLAAWRLLQAPR